MLQFFEAVSASSSHRGLLIERGALCRSRRQSSDAKRLQKAEAPILKHFTTKVKKSDARLSKSATPVPTLPEPSHGFGRNFYGAHPNYWAKPAAASVVILIGGPLIIARSRLRFCEASIWLFFEFVSLSMWIFLTCLLILTELRFMFLMSFLVTFRCLIG